MSKIAIVGCGLVGGSWAVVFARAGYEVALYDPFPTSMDATMSLARNAVEDLARQDLLDGARPAELLARLAPCGSLASALEGALYVQESAPERLEVKKALYAEMDGLAGPATILASSTSGLPISTFTEEIASRARCVVSHPINPPHLVPLVEIVPAPWTAPATVAATEALMREVGQTPIQLRHEIDGFVVNRLQSAVLAEAFRLVEDGVASVADIDAAMSDGLGLRWSFMGPFETIDLNAKGGVRDYCDKLGAMYWGLARQLADPRQWGEELVREVEAQCRSRLSIGDLKDRQLWRDQCLAKLTAFKRTRL
ncbi:MAG: 3-hydroxyacyl-CoA dehydrogenase [Amaricoccus sp.]